MDENATNQELAKSQQQLASDTRIYRRSSTASATRVLSRATVGCLTFNLSRFFTPRYTCGDILLFSEWENSGVSSFESIEQ